MMSIGQQILSLTNAVAAKQQTMGDALTALTQYLQTRDTGIPTAERRDFARILLDKKAAEGAVPNGTPFQESELIGAALRMHMARNFKHADLAAPISADDDTPYQQARAAFLNYYQQTALNLVDSQTDYAIGVSCEMLNERLEAKKWLASSLSMLVRAAQRKADSAYLADAVPLPDAPPLGQWRTWLLNLFRIERAELGRRSVRDFREMARLQDEERAQLAGMLADAFESVGDKISARQARSYTESVH